MLRQFESCAPPTCLVTTWCTTLSLTLLGQQELPLDHTRAHVNEHMLLVHSMANLPSVITARSCKHHQCRAHGNAGGRLYSSLSSSLSIRVAGSSIATRRAFHGAFQGQEYFMTRRNGNHMLSELMLITYRL